MGLDTVEMIMDIEERFGIEISNSDVGAIRTVGELSDLVERLVAEKPQVESTPICLTSRAFFRLRKGLTACCGVARKQVRPDAKLDELLALKSRRARWRQLGDGIALELPQLFRPGWCWWLGMAAIAAMIAYAWFRWGIGPGIGIMVWASIGATIVGLIVVERLTRPFEVYFSPEALTCGELARSVAARNFEALSADGVAVRGEEIWQAVVQTVADSAGACPEKISRTTRIVEDLAMD